MTQVRQLEAQRIFKAAVARYQMYPEYRNTFHRGKYSLPYRQ